MNKEKIKNTKLSNIKLVFGIMDEYKDCTYCHAIVYSYLLCKYYWFKKQNKEYFESQETIAESCRSKYSTVRNSIKWLEEKGLVKVAKVHTRQYNKNAYVVEDRYMEYTTGDNIPIIQDYFEEEEDPFLDRPPF